MLSKPTAESAEVTLLDDSGPGNASREALRGAAALAPWMYRQFDPGRLAQAAGEAFAEMSPLVSRFSFLFISHALSLSPMPSNQAHLPLQRRFLVMPFTCHHPTQRFLIQSWITEILLTSGADMEQSSMSR